ncbi:MAG: hypothetical protein U9P38_06350 [Campylobacterota bacterium]|nr:hypothetical protein [Campylobacterota bacterium]
MSEKRRIIYVDASGNDIQTEFKISLYDPEKSLTHILKLENCTNSSEAERYAIFNAIFYIKKHNYKNSHILCDNLSAVNDKYIQKASKEQSVNLSWIPREINVIADKISKLEPTLKEKDWNVLKLFVDLYRRDDLFELLNQETQKEKTLAQEIEKLKKELEEKKTKIANQAKQLTQKNNQVNQLKQKS